MPIYTDTMTDEKYNSDDLELQVCSSPAGYYVGQLEPCGAPFSRLSGYCKSFGDAKKALKDGWPVRDAVENRVVNEGLVSSGKIVVNDVR